FGFWKHELIFGKNNGEVREKEGGMGQFGKITSVEDLPKDKVMIGYLKEGMRLNDEGVKIPRTRPKKRKPLVVPDYFLTALAKNIAHSVSHQRSGVAPTSHWRLKRGILCALASNIAAGNSSGKPSATAAGGKPSLTATIPPNGRILPGWKRRFAISSCAT